MRTTLILDDKLVAEAFRHSTARTTSALVHEALSELVRTRRRRSLADLRGQIRFAPGFDHRKLRAGR